ncbi:MAG: hypothetical protein QQN41_08535 [Nitrosopumilus sp.]
MPEEKVSISKWFDDLCDWDQNELITLTQNLELSHPTEYSTGHDLLLDVCRVRVIS